MQHKLFGKISFDHKWCSINHLIDASSHFLISLMQHKLFCKISFDHKWCSIDHLIDASYHFIISWMQHHFFFSITWSSIDPQFIYSIHHVCFPPPPSQLTPPSRPPPPHTPSSARRRGHTHLRLKKEGREPRSLEPAVRAILLRAGRQERSHFLITWNPPRSDQTGEGSK